MISQTLAHYKILEKIGSGGMGDVYLAEDTKLDRKVALKVLPPELAENEERRARFRREAKAIAALNHPNIVTVYSVEEADGIHFITMELVKGKTLTELIPSHGFALNQFFDIAVPFAHAVASAHQEGITHRDLKPDNVMVGDDGRVKVLDYGLAKPTSGFVGGDAGSAFPTAAKTAEGVIVGTLHYMSPEQAQGEAVDAPLGYFLPRGGVQRDARGTSTVPRRYRRSDPGIDHQRDAALGQRQPTRQFPTTWTESFADASRKI